MIGAPVREAIRSSPPPQLSPRNPTRDYLSYSAVTTYQNCPLRYYFRYVDGLSERTVSASLVFGSAIHRAVEHHFNELLATDEPPPLDALCGEYDRYWRDVDPQTVRFGKKESIDSLGQLAIKMLGAFQMSPIARPTGCILGVEEELRGAIVPGCRDVLGRLDLVVETADALVVTDFKTARSRWSQETANASAGQLHLYHELVRGIAPNKAIRLHFAVLAKCKKPSVELHEVSTEPKRIARSKLVVERVSRAIESGIFYPNPSPATCAGCPFKEPCRGWKG